MTFFEHPELANNSNIPNSEYGLGYSNQPGPNQNYGLNQGPPNYYQTQPQQQFWAEQYPGGYPQPSGYAYPHQASGSPYGTPYQQNFNNPSQGPQGYITTTVPINSTPTHFLRTRP